MDQILFGFSLIFEKPKKYVAGHMHLEECNLPIFEEQSSRSTVPLRMDSY